MNDYNFTGVYLNKITTVHTETMGPYYCMAGKFRGAKFLLLIDELRKLDPIEINMFYACNVTITYNHKFKTDLQKC